MLSEKKTVGLADENGGPAGGPATLFGRDEISVQPDRPNERSWWCVWGTPAYCVKRTVCPKKGKEEEMEEIAKKFYFNYFFLFFFCLLWVKTDENSIFRKIRRISEIARYIALSPNPYKYLY